MIVNKEDFKNDTALYFMLTQIEEAYAKKNMFSIQVITTRLKNLGLKLKENTLAQKITDEEILDIPF